MAPRLWPRSPWRWLLWGLALALAAGLYGVWRLDATVRAKFEGHRWAVPAHVYARPLTLYRGLALSPAGLEAELMGLGYRADGEARSPGSYRRHGGVFLLTTRRFRFWDGLQPSRAVRVVIEGGRVVEVTALRRGRDLPLLRLEPVLVGSVYPGLHEDRIPLRLSQVPAQLVAALVAVEDRAFFRHHGLAPRSLVRALWANLRAGRTVQGGSTLTQQLVKNFYLTAERSLRRKLLEAVMALLLEWHYDKEDILETYINEVYLGQHGTRAIHGFGLASHFYFGRPLQELRLSELALLVGMIKGPSYYNPRRHPERARARRDLVLDALRDQGLIDEAAWRVARAAPLGVSPRPLLRGGGNQAYLELVRRQLRRDYLDEDLRAEGLRVFTGLDLKVQEAAEQAVARVLARLERARGLDPGSLEAAVVVSRVADGEVLAVVGGRRAAFAGFNRALDARRPVGSLLKPAVYLTALARPRRYHLVSPLDDSPLEYEAPGAPPWRPRNYDGEFHGRVPLFLALAHSYNVATARLALELGIPAVLETLRRLGVAGDFPPYPSLALGAVALTPLQVARMYQTLAGLGFRVPLQAVRAVTGPGGQALARYGLTLQQAFEPAPVYLLDVALQEVVRRGTARGLGRWLPARLQVAGKTGTTDEYRDSWFAGFTGNHLAVVWVGRDDNRPTGLTGAAGAMVLWGELMGALDQAPLELDAPPEVEWLEVDPARGALAPGCAGALRLPFIRGSAPADRAPCAGARPAAPRRLPWWRRLFRFR